MVVTSTNEEKVLISIDPKTAQGNSAPIDGSVNAEVIDGDATIQTVDEKSFYVVSGPGAGISNIKVSADADMGEGVRTIEDTIEYAVTAAEATGLGLTVGTAEPK